MGMIIEKLVLVMVRTNCYIVYDSENLNGFIIDPADNGDIIMNKVKSKNINILAVFLTHGHFDHIGAAEHIRDVIGVKIYGGEEEKDIFTNPSFNLSSLYMDDISLNADVFLKDDDVINLSYFKIKAIHTPGHTNGGLCFFVSLFEEEVLFSGDTIFRDSYGRYDFPTGSLNVLLNSIKSKLLILKDDLKVFPGHNEITFIGDEKRNYR